MATRRFKLIKQGLDDGSVLSDLNDVASTAPANGQTIVWNGTEWVPANHNDLAGLTTGDPHTQYGLVASTETISAKWTFSVAPEFVSFELGHASDTTFTRVSAGVVAIEGVNIARENRQVISGAGLTGGGDLSADRTLAVGAGAGISVAADSVALDLTYSPTWSGDHTFTGNLNLSAAGPRILQIETDQAADAQRWVSRPNAGTYQIGATLDDNSAFRAAFAATRNAASSAIESIAIGNATNDPDLDLLITELQIQGDAGSSGDVLTSNGTGAAPSWEAPGAASLDLGDLATLILADSPLGYWKCDEASGNFADSSGNSRTMTAAGSPSYRYGSWVPNETQKYVYFDTNGDGATRSDTCGLTVPANGDWTFECIMIVTAATTVCGPFGIGGNAETEVANYQVRPRFVASTRAMGAYWENSTGTDQNTNSVLAAAEAGFPHHYAWVKDGTANTVTFYIDGILYDAVAYTTEPTGGSTATSQLGANDISGTAQGPFGLAHAALYSTALTQAKIRARAKAAGFLLYD